MHPENSQNGRRFLITGGTSALLNLGVLSALVSAGGFSEGWELDLANALALEAGIIYSFLLCRHWVWPFAGTKRPFWREFAVFHGAVALTAIVRVGLFALFRTAEVPYLLNAAMCILVGAMLSYGLYDRWVFSRR